MSITAPISIVELQEYKTQIIQGGVPSALAVYQLLNARGDCDNAH
jgi:hypothetical protein